MHSSVEQESPLLSSQQIEQQGENQHDERYSHGHEDFDIENTSTHRGRGDWRSLLPADLHRAINKSFDWLHVRNSHANVIFKSLSGHHIKWTSFTSSLPTIFNYPQPNQRLRDTAWLDGLRGLAAFEVFLCHYLDFYWPIDKNAYWGAVEDGNNPSWYYLPMVRTLWLSAATSVNLFFAISGYVLSHRMLVLIQQQRQHEMWPALSSAIFRRWIRLFAPVLAMSGVFMLLGRIGFPHAEGVKYDRAPSFSGEVRRWLSSFIGMFLPVKFPAGWPGIAKLMVYDGGISWSIPWEYYGSLQVYMSVLLLAYVPRYTVRVCLISIWIVFWGMRDDWVATQFLLGLAFADYQINKAFNAEDSKRTRPRTIILCVMFTLGWYISGLPTGRLINGNNLRPRPGFDWISPPASWYVHLQADRVVQSLGAMLCMVAIGELPQLKRCLEWRPTQYLGRISFGLYLSHVGLRPCLKPLVLLIVRTLGVADVKEARYMVFIAWVVWMIPAALLNFFVAGLFTRFIDEPSVRAGRKFERWCRSSPKGVQ